MDNNISLLSYLIFVSDDKDLILDVIKKLDYVDRRNNDGRTALAELITKRFDIDIAEALLEKGANINNIDYYGKSALSRAISKKSNIKAIRFLVDNGIDISTAEFVDALYSGSVDIVEVLLKKNPEFKKCISYSYKSQKSTPFLRAVKNKKVNFINYLFEQGLCITKQEEAFAFLITSQQGHDNIMGTLIKNGLDINAKDDEGKTALMYAAQRGNIEGVKLLLENNANILIKDNMNKTAMDYTDNPEIMALLRNTKKQKLPAVLIKNYEKTR